MKNNVKNLFLTILKLKKRVSMQLTNYLIYWDMLLINIKLSKYVTKLF